MSIRRHVVSIKFALEGIRLGLNTQPNFRVHILISILVIISGFYFQISHFEFQIILLLIGLGLGFEFFNTAIEYTVDLLTDKHHLLAKFAKDCAAASMLIYSIFAALIGLIIFLPKIFIWLSI